MLSLIIILGICQCDNSGESDPLQPLASSDQDGFFLGQGSLPVQPECICDLIFKDDW